MIKEKLPTMVLVNQVVKRKSLMPGEETTITMTGGMLTLIGQRGMYYFIALFDFWRSAPNIAAGSMDGVAEITHEGGSADITVKNLRDSQLPIIWL